MAGVATICPGLLFAYGKFFPAAILAGHAIGPSHVHKVFLTRFFTGESVKQTHDADGTVGIPHDAILRWF